MIEIGRLTLFQIELHWMLLISRLIQVELCNFVLFLDILVEKQKKHVTHL